MTGERLIFKGAFHRCTPDNRQWLSDEIVEAIRLGEFWKTALQKYYDLGKDGWTQEKADEFAAFVEFCYRQRVVYNEKHE